MFHLAQCYEHGKGVEKDLAKAIEWYKAIGAEKELERLEPPSGQAIK